MRYALLLLCLLPQPANAAEIIPRDGPWTTRVTDITLTDICPDQTKAVVLPQFEDSLDQTSTQQIAFEGDFHPEKLDEANRPYDWVQTAENEWQGKMLRDGDDREIGTMTLTVKTDTQISVSSQIELADMLNPQNDPNFTAMFPPDCAARLNFEVDHGAS